MTKSRLTLQLRVRRNLHHHQGSRKEAKTASSIYPVHLPSDRAVFALCSPSGSHVRPDPCLRYQALQHGWGLLVGSTMLKLDLSSSMSSVLTTR
eukprot:26404-Eustigmatos_ZCMA.PRE.1